MKNPLIFAHIGDLHITKAKEQNYVDLLSIVSQLEVECSDKLDFVILPGDNADNGLPEQYKLVETALKMLSVPVYIIPGDHDMEQGSVENYSKIKFTEKLPKSLLIRGYRCLFLDVSGPGKGGPDFRFGEAQFSWLKAQFDQVKEASEKVVLFMHTYPSDLKDSEEKKALNQLIAENEVVLVDMGHTHYNELANDGTTIFSATRSTGQIEEGPVGYSLVTIEDGKVSWRFKPLADAFPFVMITSPTDYRLATQNDIAEDSNNSNNEVEVEAVVFGARKVKEVNTQILNSKTELFPSEDMRTWSGLAALPNLDPAIVNVEAIDESGRPGMHMVTLSKILKKATQSIKDGSDADTIGAWPENGIFGTQLGPNSNAKPVK